MLSRPRRILSAAALFLAGALVASLVVWSVMTIARPAESAVEAVEHTLVEVSAGEVGASIQLNTTASWTTTPLGENRAVGIVTGASLEPGQEVQVGTAVYSVNLRPTVVAEGAVPAFRDIAEGASGADVRQLQVMLTALDFYEGEINGAAGAATVAAIRDWQRSLDVERTGIVASGDIIYLPRLPARVALNSETIRLGATLNGGEAVLSVLPASPKFTLPVTKTQAALVPGGARVEIASSGGDTWEAVAGEQHSDSETGTVTITLNAMGDGPICGEDCATIPVEGQSTLSGRVITVETVEGLTVPSSALITTADGKLALVREDGSLVAVTVKAAAQGVSIVEGVQIGDTVRVPGATSR